MACYRMGGAIVCVNPWGSITVNGKRMWLEFHEYCGPTFYTDRSMTKVYEPKDETDAVWPAFAGWLKRYQSRKAKNAAAKKEQEHDK